ncbi:MAG: Omp85 family outer membrane protein [Myxococcaceae bacterium]
MAIHALALTLAVLAATPAPADALAALANQATPPPPPAPDAPKEEGIDAIAIPLISYNTDLGLGLGAAAGAYFHKKGYVPYRHGVAAQVFFTTKGVQSHFLRYDGPRLLGPLRVEARLDLKRELYAPYFGLGNLSAPGVEDSPSSRDRRFAFDYISPGGGVRLRGAPLEKGALQVYGGYSYRYTMVRPYPGTLLQKEQPVGIEGGSTGQIQLGALFDTRENETDPTYGGVEELSFLGSSLPTGSSYTYGGFTVSERRFFSLGTPKLIFAQRLYLDLLFGEVPFYEFSSGGGLQVPEGVGGMNTVRGVPRNRYIGVLKVVSNSELRFYPYQFQLLGAPVKVGGLVYFDLGRVWHPDVVDGAWYAWHPGVGAGFRASRRSAVVRIDYGLATETLRSAFYITFGHMF